DRLGDVRAAEAVGGVHPGAAGEPCARPPQRDRLAWALGLLTQHAFHRCWGWKGAAGPRDLQTLGPADYGGLAQTALPWKRRQSSWNSRRFWEMRPWDRPNFRLTAWVRSPSMKQIDQAAVPLPVGKPPGGGGGVLKPSKRGLLVPAGRAAEPATVSGG